MKKSIKIFFILWSKKGKDPKIKKTIIAEYEPPTNLHPAEAEVLLKEKVSQDAIPATLVDLAVRGYLKIIEKKKISGGFSPSGFANSISFMASLFVRSASNSGGGASFGGGRGGRGGRGAGGGGGGAG